MAVDAYIGRVLMGQFQLQAQAGRGAMGTVYRARQLNMDRTVAVKVLRGDLLKDTNAVHRFLREAQAAARLSHPNIVTVHLVGESEAGVPFIVMEYIEGQTLSELCEREHVLDPVRALRIARQIASALGEAHGQGIVHRDLKPENILLDARRAPADFIKVFDFGIAKLLGGEGGEIAQLTRDGTIFGTPHYIAPEQAAGKEVDGRADLYSLGVILYRMCTGQLPFDGGSGMQVLMRHVRDAPPRPRSVRPELPDRVEQLIMTALAKDRDQRFPNAERMVAAIDAVENSLVGAPVRAIDPGKTLMGVTLPRQSDSRPIVMPARTHESGPALVAVAAPLDDDPSRTRPGEASLEQWSTAGEGEIASTGRFDAGDAGMWEEERPSSRRGAKLAGVVIGAVALSGLAFWALSGRTATDKKETAPPPSVVTDARPPLVEEHVASAGPFAMRVGFESAPSASAPTRLRVTLGDANGRLVSDAAIEVGVRGSGREELQPMRADADAYVADLTFHAPGRHHIRVSAEPRVGKRFAANFDVEVIGSAARPVPTAPRAVEEAPARTPRPHRERSPADPAAPDDTLPVTVIPGGGPPDTAPILPRSLGPAPGSLPGGKQPAARKPAPPPPPPPEPAVDDSSDPPADPYQVLDKKKR